MAESKGVKTGGRGNANSRPRPLADSVLRLIWKKRRISRAEIAQVAGLSRSTVSEIVGPLLATGLVAEVGEGESRGGRRPIVLEFQDDACVILGVDIGASHVSVVLTDLRDTVLAFEHHYHGVRDDPVGTIELVVRTGLSCLEAAGRTKDALVGIGVAVPSPVDPNDPDHLSHIVIPGWHGYSVQGAIGRHFLDVPVHIDNDANLGALAERWWGAGQGVDDFAFIKVATGIGAGHIVRGEIYRGATGVAGEIGHMAIDPSGGECVCGLRGCLTTFVGGEALAARVAELASGFPDSQLAGAELTVEMIEDAALDGDPLALKVVTEAAEYLGIAIAGMLNLMNPSMVVIGGGLARAGDKLLEPLRDTVKHRTLVSSVAAAEIRNSELGPRSIAVGAATLVLDRALKNPRMFPRVRKGKVS